METNNNPRPGIGERHEADHERGRNSSGETQGSSLEFPKGDSNIQDIAIDDDFEPHHDAEPGFAYIDGEVGGTGYNETKVDIVAVPCPGADPLQPWIGSEPFPDGYFSPDVDVTVLASHPAVKELAVDAILSPGINRNLPRAAHVWVRQGVRKASSTARVLLYRHRKLAEGVTLEELAEDLMREVARVREGLHSSRPLFFLGHSVGGLVVKILLLKASRSPQFRHLMYNCHGVAFFGEYTSPVPHAEEDMC